MIDPAVINKTIDRSGHTVLVVDDNAATRYSTSRVIGAAGFRTIEAGSGSEALALAAKGVSAVVLDVHLPDIDGFAVCRRLRAQPETAMLPIVHLSAAYIKDEDRVTGLNAGADAYMVHPVEPAVLVATLQALVRARTAEDQLRRSEQRFRTIYHQAESGIALLDGHRRFDDVNPAMQRLLGRSAEQLLHHPLSEFAPVEWHGFVERSLGQSAADGQPWRGEFPLTHTDGSLVHLEWNISAHAEPGGRIAIASDISQRHELEQRRRELLEREQAARAVAERHSRTKDDFIAVLSHELRTPLNAIVGWVHILKRRGSTPEGAKGLDAIERSVKTQARIISDILDVSRINSGKLMLEREYIDPSELIQVAIASLADLLAERKIRVSSQLEQAPEPAWLDPTRFQQIFWNLMTNAIKFSPEGAEVLVALRRDGGQLRLTVQDRGTGIKAEFLPHLFDRFSQSDAPGNRRHGGLGLGLSIVKHLVDLHGGTVSAESAGEGCGTIMRVALPALASSAAEGVDSIFPADDPHDRWLSLEGVDVLVVEDDRDASEMMSVVLADRGASVRCVGSFERAVQALESGWPDVLVSDIGLPGRDGYELVRWVRSAQADRGAQRLPAIALTAFTRPEDARKSLGAGFDLHLGKPLRPHLLLEAIRQLLPPGRSA